MGRSDETSLPEYPETVAKRKLDAAVGLLRSKEAWLRELESHDAEWAALLDSVPQPSRVVSQASAPPHPAKEPAQANTSASKRKVIWSHSDDYRKIVFKGRTYRLTEQQASIVRLLDDARRTGDGCLSIQRIKAGTKCGRLADSFRAGDGPKLWKNLVVAETGYKSMYKLDLPDDLTVDLERNPA